MKSRAFPGLTSLACLLVCLQLFHDSVGKFGIDQVDQATDDEKRRMRQAEQAKAFPENMIPVEKPQQVCLYYTQKLVMQHELLSPSFCLVV